MWRDLTAGLMSVCRDTFGEPMLYQSKNAGPAYLINGIFEESNDYAALDSRAELEGFIAFVDFRTEDLTFKPKRGDMIIVQRNGKPFKIIKPEDDGFSRVRLYLKEFVPS